MAQKLALELSADEAVVLYGFLERFTNSERLEIVDQSEQRALWDLCAILAKRLVEPFDPAYRELLAAAQERMRDTP